MALHRDIFWIGRQWAVTGSGIQAVDQRNGAFDLDVSRIWDAAALASLREQPWFNEADFEKALMMARARFSAPSTAVVEPLPEVSLPRAIPEAAQPAEVLQPTMALSIRVQSARARFLPQWRLRQ